MQGLGSISAHLRAPKKTGLRWSILILSPLLETPRMQGLGSISAHLRAPKKARVRSPLLILR